MEMVHFSSEMYGQLKAVIRGMDVAYLSDEMFDIAENIIDAYEDVSVNDVTAAEGITLQEMIEDMEKSFVFYLPLLNESLCVFRTEHFLCETEVAHLLGGAPQSKGLLPRLFISDGSTEFALMQVAACQAGVSDAYVRFWYKFLSFLLYSIHVEMLNEGDVYPIDLRPRYVIN